MQDIDKTKEDLVTEVVFLRQRVAELEQAETERTEAEEALRQSEDKYRSLFELAGDGICTIDLNGVVTDANAQLEKILGVDSKTEIIGKSPTDFAPPSDRGNALEIMKKIIEEGTSNFDEHILIKPDGTQLSAEIKASQLKDNRGNPAGIIAVVRDITERKEAEEALKIKDNAITSSISAIAIAEFGGRNVTYVNPAFLRMWGYGSEKEVLGKSGFDFVHEQERVQDIIEALAKGEDVVGELQGKKKDGSLFDAQLSASTVMNEAGEPVYMMASFVDITERKQAEQERLANVHFLESMDRVNRAIQGTNDLGQMMKDVLDEVLAIFDCDRAYLAYPCDPSAATWQVPMECTKPEYPGMLELGLEIPMDAETAERLRISLDSDGCMKDGPGTPYPVPAVLARKFQIKCSMILAIHPKLGKPWQFGIQQCSYARVWTAEEERLFQEIGRRLADGLTSLLMYRDLKESEEKYRDLIDKEKDIIFTLDDKGNITFVNPAVEAILGYRPEEIEGKNFMVLIPEEWQEKAVTDFNTTLKTGEITAENILLDKKGQPHFVETNSTTIKEGDKVVGIRGISRDITERIKAEEALLEREKRFSDIADNALEWIWEVDINGKYIYSSPVVEEILGYKPEELLKKHFYDLFLPEDREELKKAAFEVFAQKQPFNEFKNQCVHKDGKIVWLSTSGVPIIDEKGNLLGYRGADTDITEREKAEEEHLAHLRFLESMDRVNRAMHGTNDLQKMMRDVLDVVLDIFDCDRTWLLYPCDPETTSWQVPMECTQPDYPGVSALGTEIPIEEDAAKLMQTVLDSVAPVKFGSGFDYPLPQGEASLDQQSLLAMAIYPKVGKPWMFGLHQCSYVRVWTPQEERLFQEIGRRLTDGLTSLLVYRDLQESEEQFRALFEGAPDAIFLADPESGEILDANAAASHLLLREHEEIIGLHQSQLHPQHMEKYVREAFSEHLQQSRRKKKIRPIESSIIRTDGSEVPVEVLAQIVRIHGKDVIQGNFRDITERKQAEEALRVEKNRLQVLMDGLAHIDVGIDVVGVDYRVQLQNRVLEERFGDLTGKLCYENYLGIKEPCDLCPMIKAVENNSVESTELTGTDGKNYELISAPLPNPDGTVEKAIEVVRDITERKQAEEELRQSEERYRFLFENSQTINLLIGTDGKILDVNENAAESLGYKKKNIIGKEVLEFVIPEQREEVTRQLALELKGEYTPPFEIDIVTKKGIRTILFTEGHATLFEKGELKGMLLSAVDITERKQVEEKLKESEERFRTIFETAQDFIFLKDRDAKYTAVNPAMERYFDVPASKLIGKTAATMFDKAMTARIREEDLRVLNGDIINEEHASSEKGRTDIHHIIKVPIRNSAGEIIGLCGIGRDISDRKRAEDALRESEERYRTLVNNIDIGINLIDADHTVIMANASIENKFDKSMDDVIGKKCFQEFEQRDTVCSDCPGVQTMATGQPAEVEHELVVDDQGTFYVRIQTFPIFGQDGTVTGFTEIAEDITERKQTEAALRESEEKFRELAEQSPNMIFINTKGKVVYANKACKEMMGYTQKEFYDPHFDFFTLIAPEYEDEVKERYDRHMKGDEVPPYEYTLITKKGERINAIISPKLIQYGGESAILGTITNITERKQMEQELRESEEKYRSLVESSEDPIYLVDRNCNYIFMNNRHLSRLGVKSDQVIGRSYDEFHSPKESKDFAQRVKTVVKTGKSLSYEYQSQRDNRFFIRTLSPVLSTDREISAITVISKDITERKHSEEKLRESEERFRTIFEAAQDLIFIKDRDLTYTAINPAMERYYDVSASKMIGKTATYLFGKKVGLQGREEDMRILKGEIIDIERSFKLQGKTVVHNLIKVPMRNSAGEIIGICGTARDITEQKQAEEALREREAFNYALFQYNPIETIVVDLEGRVTGFNLAKETSGGRLPTFGDRMYKDYAGKHESDMRTELIQCISTGEIKEFPDRKYGDKYLSITISPFSKGAIIISEDITDRKRAEELLLQERDTFYTILERAPYGVMVVDADDNHSFLNTEFTNITGYTLEDIPTTQEWWHRAYPDKHYRNMVKEIWEKDYTQNKAEETFRKQFGRVFARAFTVLCKDGATKEIEFRTAAVADEGTIFMLSDITDRKRMHNLLETAAAEWRTTFDAISDAVCLLDSQGKIIRCNNAMLKLLGKTFSEITNHHCWEVMHGTSEALHNCPIERVSKTHQRENEVMFKDERWINVSVDPLFDDEGNFIGGVHIMSDITDRMRIQNELQDSQEQLRNLTGYLQSVREQERTNIAREIHDELAQALTALKMDVSWIDRRLPDDAQSLSEKTESMDKLIDNTIQTVKRISAELRPGVLDDLGLVAAIEWQAEEFQNRTGISCHVTVDPEDLTVDQDRSTAIFRILQETLTNVARHARATRVAVSLKEKGGRLTLRVRDNGTGITEEQISAPQSFGLIGIRERVHPWDGKVSIKGIQGKGTTVLVRVERARSNSDIETIESSRSPS